MGEKTLFQNNVHTSIFEIFLCASFRRCVCLYDKLRAGGEKVQGYLK